MIKKLAVIAAFLGTLVAGSLTATAAADTKPAAAADIGVGIQTARECVDYIAGEGYQIENLARSACSSAERGDHEECVYVLRNSAVHPWHAIVACLKGASD